MDSAATCMGPFAERLTLTLLGHADAMGATAAFRSVFPPAMTLATPGDRAQVCMPPEALAHLLCLAADGDPDLADALTLADHHTPCSLWLEPLQRVEQARRRITRDSVTADYKAAFAVQLGLPELSPVLAILARVRGAFETLAARADLARSEGTSLGPLEVYDATTEALGMCTCGALPGELHRQDEDPACPATLYWGTWEPLLGDAELAALADIDQQPCPANDQADVVVEPLPFHVLASDGFGPNHPPLRGCMDDGNGVREGGDNAR